MVSNSRPREVRGKGVIPCDRDCCCSLLGWTKIDSDYSSLLCGFSPHIHSCTSSQGPLEASAAAQDAAL